MPDAKMPAATKKNCLRFVSSQSSIEGTMRTNFKWYVQLRCQATILKLERSISYQFPYVIDSQHGECRSLPIDKNYLATPSKFFQDASSI